MQIPNFEINSREQVFTTIGDSRKKRNLTITSSDEDSQRNNEDSQGSGIKARFGSFVNSWVSGEKKKVKKEPPS